MITHSKPWIVREEIKHITNFLKNDDLSTTKYNVVFEKNLKRKFKIKNAVLTKSGTHALINAIKILGIKKNDEIILPSYVCKNVLDAIIINGAIPIYCDIGDNWLITYEKIKRCISNKTKCIIVVHTFGFAAKIEQIKKLKIPIIEDACQAIGLKIQKKYSGTVGDLGVYSFDSTKCMTTINGGLLICNNKTYLKQFKKMKNYLDSSLENSFSSIQAKLGISQLNRYDQFVRKRKLIYSKFYKELSNINSIKIKKIKQNYLFRFTFKTKIPFKTLEKKFKNEGIIIKKGVDKVLHVRNKKNDTKYKKTISTFNETVSIPFYPSLSNTEVKKIINSTKKIFNDFNN